MLTCKIPRRYRISSWHCLIITFEESWQKMCFIIFLWSVSICHITHSCEAILWDLQVYLQRHEVAKLELCLSDTVESQGLSYCHTQNFIKHRCVFPLYFSYLSFIPSFESCEWEILFPCDGSDALPWTWLWHWVRFDECIWVPRQQKTLFPAPKRCPVASPPASSVNVSLFKLLVDICLASDSTAVLLTLSWNKVWYTFFRKLLHFSWILHS